MKLARWIYLAAALYGLAILIPGLFLEARVDPSGALLAHPEFYYGFYGSALAWQVAFLLIASDPVRFRPLMPVTFLEKLAFPASNIALYAMGRMTIDGPFIGGLIDLALCALFVVAWLKTPRATPAAP